MNESDIKALTPTRCPACGEQLIVEIITTAPGLSGVYTVSIIEGAKQEAIRRISELKIPEEFTKPVIDWINSSETMFGPNDIDEIIKNIKNESREKA